MLQSLWGVSLCGVSLLLSIPCVAWLWWRPTKAPIPPSNSSGDYDVELGDILSGNLETEGAETIRNVSQSERMDAYVQGVYPTEEPAIEIIC